MAKWKEMRSIRCFLTDQTRKITFFDFDAVYENDKLLNDFLYCNSLSSFPQIKYRLYLATLIL